MPTYEYICTACEHQWEAEQSMKEDALSKCPQCKKSKAKRQISGGTGFLLKGGGWYSDLYGSSPPPAAESDSTEKSTSDTSKTSGKSDKSDGSDSADKKADPKTSSGDGAAKKSTSSKGSAKGS